MVGNLRVGKTFYSQMNFSQVNFRSNYGTMHQTPCGIKVCEASPPKIQFIRHLSLGIYGSHGQNKSNPATGVQNSISVTRQQQTLNDNSTPKVLTKVDDRKPVKDISPTSTDCTQCQCDKQKNHNSVEQNLQIDLKQLSNTDGYNKTISAVTACNWEMPANNVAVTRDDIRPRVPFKQKCLKEQCFDDIYHTFKSATTNSCQLKNYHSCSRINLKQIAKAMEEYRSRLQSANILPNLPNIHALLMTNKVINLDKVESNDFKRTSNRGTSLKSTSEIPIQLTTALDGSMLYCCSECTMAYSSKELLEDHLVVHKEDRRIACDECGVSLKRKEHLEQHKQAHSHDRPFVCDVCRKAFKRNEHLKRHVVTHSGDKSHECARCGKAFSRKDHLIKHLVTHRQEDPIGPGCKNNM